jgi:hypothetical protein
MILEPEISFLAQGREFCGGQGIGQPESNEIGHVMLSPMWKLSAPDLGECFRIEETHEAIIRAIISQLKYKMI